MFLLALEPICTFVVSTASVDQLIQIHRNHGKLRTIIIMIATFYSSFSNFFRGWYSISDVAAAAATTNPVEEGCLPRCIEANAEMWTSERRNALQPVALLVRGPDHPLRSHHAQRSTSPFLRKPSRVKRRLLQRVCTSCCILFFGVLSRLALLTDEIQASFEQARELAEAGVLSGRRLGR